MGKGWCDIDPNELVFTFGVLTSMQILVKVDQEMRRVRVPTDGHTE